MGLAEKGRAPSGSIISILGERWARRSEPTMLYPGWFWTRGTCEGGDQTMIRNAVSLGTRLYAVASVALLETQDKAPQPLACEGHVAGRRREATGKGGSL